ncbi:hypothetical protein ACFWBC_04970 [Streptomyces sp. NPDC059985]|uniref:hypothetical protein n=1 Tax=Streptomyces sp. NPDC059985 TaxID=3347025 RepID=UPI0036A79714
MYDTARAAGPDGGSGPEPDRRAAPHPGGAPAIATVRELVAGLAPLLGLDPDRITIEAAGPGLDGALGGARAAATEDRLLLRPSQLADPEPALLVHELAHVAQHRNRLRRPSEDFAAGGPHRARRRPDLTASEAEAAALAGAARGGGALWRPRAVLPDGVLARDSGASGVEPRELAELTERVAFNHADEIARITEFLGSFWTPAETALDSVLEVLDRLDFVVARALVQGLGAADVRRKLALLSREQYAAHPHSAAAVLAALDVADLIAVQGRGYRLGHALGGLDPSLLRAAEVRGVRDTVRRMGREARALADDLMTGPAGPVLSTLIQVPEPPGTDEEQVRAALAEERRVSSARRAAYGTDRPLTVPTRARGADTLLLRGLTELLRSPDAAAARQALERIGALVDPQGRPEGGTPDPAARYRLSALVTELDTGGLLDRLLDSLATADRHQSVHSRILSAVLAVRRPSLTLPRIESLLSYGLFDWAVTDSDARFAHLLVRTLPKAEQEAWRRRDGGKWYRRLQDNLPAGVFDRGEYQGVGAEFDVTHSGPEPDEKQIADRLGKVLAAWRANPTGPTALDQLGRLAVREVDGTGAPAGTYVLRAAVVRRLDAMGVLPRMIAELPERHLTAEDTRHLLVALSGLRDPVNVQNHVIDLLVWYSPRRAWMAHQMLRGLPGAEQQDFDVRHPGVWSAVWLALTPAMRASTAAGALTGEGESDRDRLRARLLDERLWAPDRRPELRALLNMAYHADDRVWVREELAKHPDHRDLEDLVERMRQPERLPFLRAGGAFGILWFAVGALATLRGVTRHTMHFDLDLDELQRALHGDIVGVQTTRHSDKGGSPSAATGPNRVSIEFDPTGGSLTLRAPALDLRQLNLAFPGHSFHTGDVRLRGLVIRAGYSDHRFSTPVGARIDAESLDVRDALKADPDLRGGAVALTSMLLKRLSLHADGAGENFPGPRPGTIAVPVFGPLIQALDNLVTLTGGLPGAPSFLGLAMMPLTQPLSSLESTLVTRGAGHFDPTESPLDYVAGLLQEGTLRRPRTLAERAREAAGRLHTLEVSFDELSVSGLTFGTEQQVSSVHIAGLTMGTARSLPAYLRLRKRALERLKARDPARKEEADAAIMTIRSRLRDLRSGEERDRHLPDEELDKPLGKERRLEVLEARDRLNPGTLDPSEQAELTRLSDELRADMGLVLDIGGLTVGELHGRITGSGASLDGGLHLHARLPSELLGPQAARYLPARELLTRFLAGGDRPSLAALLNDPERTVEYELEGGPIRLLEDRSGKRSLRIAATRVPPSGVLRARLDALNAIGDPTVREQTAELRTRLEEAVGLARQVEKWRGNRAPLSQKEIEDEERLLDLLGFSAENVEIGALSGGLRTRQEADGTTSTRIEARASGLLLTGVRGPEFSAGGIDGAVGGGVAVRGNTVSPAFSLDLTAQDVRTDKGTAGAFSVQGMTGSVVMLPDGYRVPDLKIDTVRTSDLAFGEPSNGFGGRSATLAGISLDAELHQPRQGSATAVVNRLRIDSITGSGLGYVHTDAHGSLRVSMESGTLRTVVAENVRYDIDARRLDSADVSIRGVDDLRFRIVSATGLTGGGPAGHRTGASGITVPTGTLTNGTGAGPFFSARYARVGERDFVLEADADFRIENTRVELPNDTSVTRPVDGLEIRRTAVSGRFRRTAREAGVSFRLKDTDLRAIAWYSGARSVTAPGPVTIGDIVVDDAVLTTPNPDRTLPAERVRRLGVKEMTVRDIRAPHVRYQDPPLDFRLGGDGRRSTGGLYIEKITLSGFALPFTASGSPDLDQLTGRIDAAGLRLPFLLTPDTVRDGIGASGRLDAQTLTVQMRPGGSASLHGQGMSGEGRLTLGRPVGHRHGLDTWLSFSGLDTGDVTITPEAVEVNGLDLPHLSVTALRFQAGAGPRFLSVEMQEGGGLDVSGVSVAARLDRYLPGEANPQHRPFKRIVLSRFHIDRVACEGLDALYGAGSDGLHVEVPKAEGGAPASLTGIDLGGPGGFVWTPDATAASVLGTVQVDELDVPRLKVAAARRFRGEVSLHSDAVKLGLLRRGSTELDMDRPSLSLLGEATLGDPRERIRLKKLGAEHLRVAEGVGTVTGLSAERLVYEQPGVRIDVEHASVPKAGLVTDLSYVQIPALDLAGAGLRIDFDALGPSSGAPGKANVSPEPMTLLDSLHGFVSLNILLRGQQPLAGYDRRDITLSTGLRIDDGMTAFDQLASSLAGGGITFDPPAGMPSALMNPAFEVRGDQLHLVTTIGPVHRSLVHWTLPTASDIDLARNRHLVRLRTLIEELGIEGRTSRARTPEDVRRETTREEASGAPRAVELTVVSSSLGARSATPLRLEFVSPAFNGSVDLGTVPLDQLHLTGSLVLAGQTGRSAAGRLRFVLGWISADSVDLTLAGGRQLKTGMIRISGIDGGSMSFEELRPRLLQARIREARALNIEWFDPVKR